MKYYRNLSLNEIAYYGFLRRFPYDPQADNMLIELMLDMRIYVQNFMALIHKSCVVLL